MLDKVKAYLAQPFRSDMDALGWFLFFGFLLAVAAGWGLILRHLKELQ